MFLGGLPSFHQYVKHCKTWDLKEGFLKESHHGDSAGKHLEPPESSKVTQKVTEEFPPR